MKRKSEHIRISLEEEIEVGDNGFGDISLIHNSLPELDFSKIELSTEFLGKKLDYPIIIEAMTGGNDEARKINKSLAKVAEDMNIGIGVGSQRPALEKGSVADSFSVVKDFAPTALKIGNLGAVQLNYGVGLEDCKKAIEMIDADALAFHLNPLQEMIQPEGDSDFSDLLEKIEDICSKLKKPVIVKEVGCGLSKYVAEKLFTAGVSCIDVGGYGGTSWGLIEGKRTSPKSPQARLAQTFSGWGIPTAISLLEVGELDIPKIASGGIRNGIEAAKSIAMGADVVGMALPLLRALNKGGEKAVKATLEDFVFELKTAMFLIGARDVACLKRKPFKVMGRAAQWINQPEL